MKLIIRAAKAVWDALREFYTILGYGMIIGFVAVFRWKIIVCQYSFFLIFCLIYWLLGGETKTILWLQLAVPGAMFICAIVIGLLATTAFSARETDNYNKRNYETEENERISR